MASRRKTKTEPARNRMGTPLASDGAPIFMAETGESRRQYLERARAEHKARGKAELEAAVAEGSEES